MLRLAILILVALALTAPAAARPLVGAIRWDAWWQGGRYERFLAPEQWHSRLPFYGRVLAGGGVTVVGDTQAVMDREIALAKAAGLDYWAFDYYHPQSWPEADRYNYGWQRYLASKHKAGLNFCLLLQGGSHMGPAAGWPETVRTFVRLFKQPTYQRVLGGRPLLYIFTVEHLERQFGSRPAARQALDELRRASQAAGAGNPYLVALIWDPRDAVVDDYGFDAVSGYTAAPWGEHREYPYADLAAGNRAFWDRCRAAGRRTIPIVNAGWDGRPRLVDPAQAKNYRGPWFAQPTPAELAANLQSALTWCRRHPATAEANTVLIYAWNETDEGGWLAPTHQEGNARLTALAEVLRPAARPSVAGRGSRRTP